MIAELLAQAKHLGTVAFFPLALAGLLTLVLLLVHSLGDIFRDRNS